MLAARICRGSAVVGSSLLFDQTPSAMRFEFILQKTLPRSAWLACLRQGHGSAQIFHGRGVEVFGNAFFEGAWDGDYPAAGFDEAVTVLGSGGRRESPGSILFVPPSHIYDRLYSARRDGTMWVSNSLAFLLERSGERLDTEAVDYARTLYRSFALDRADREIETRSGLRIRIADSANLRVDRELEVEAVAKPSTEPFSDYWAYFDFLQTTVAAVVQNAGDRLRLHPYDRPIAAVSAGYDSTATAVIAHSVGCREAVTFLEARPLAIDHYEGGSDSGSEIAERLGMNCTELNRLDYLHSERPFPEAEIFATGHLVDLYALSLEKALDSSSILFTGFRGDIMWNREIDTNQDSGGPGLSEFRLRRGFLHIPLPYLGTVDCRPERCPVTRSVRAISNSAEMTPWSVGGDYDRPIPRRIVETAGVDREAFGRAKRAVAVWYGREVPSDILQPPSLADFETFRRGVAGPEANQCLLWGLSRILERYRR